MRTRLLVVGLAIVATTAASALTQNEVIELCRAGVSGDLVIAQMRADGSRYLLDADRLLQLHREGVPEAVISAMIATRSTDQRSGIVERPAHNPTLSEQRRLLDQRPIVVNPAPVVISPYRPTHVGYRVPVTYHVSSAKPLFVNAQPGCYPVGRPTYHRPHRPRVRTMSSGVSMSVNITVVSR